MMYRWKSWRTRIRDERHAPPLTAQGTRCSPRHSGERIELSTLIDGRFVVVLPYIRESSCFIPESSMSATFCVQRRSPTCAGTLQVAESPPGVVGAPTPFFIRRPNATDISERLGRFQIEGLVALFQLGKRSYPKGKGSGVEKLVIVPDAKSAAQASVGQADPDPPAKGNKTTANKSKVGNKDSSEQPGPGDSGIDARWQAVRSEVQSNRCLVIGGGEIFSLATPPLFFDPAKTGAGEASERKPSVMGAGANAGECAGSALAEKRQTEVGCALGTSEVDARDFDESVMIGRSSPFSVCLDFRIDLVEALLNTEDGQKPMAAGDGGDIAVTGEESSVNDTIVVRIVSCGNDVEVSAVLRLWARADAPAGRDEAELAIERRESEVIGTRASGGGSSAGSLSADARSRGEAPASNALLRHPSGDGDAMPPPTPIWYLHAWTVRSGCYTGTVRCMDPAESASQQRQDLAGATELPVHSSTTTLPTPSGTVAVCDLAEWHALALVCAKDDGDDPVSLCIDGDVVALRQDVDGVAKAGTDPGDGKWLSRGGVVVGGTGGEWTALAVKNLAVYNEGLGEKQLRATTRVFRAWREEHQKAKEADAQEDERWLEEARKAEEEEREPGETTCERGVRPISTSEKHQ